MDRRILVFDICLFAGLAAALNPTLTGFVLHEWLGLAFAAVLAVHVAMRLPVLARQAWALRRPTVVGDFLVSVLLFIDLAACLVSGVLMSGSVLATLGLYAPGYLVWNPIHAFTAKAMLALGIIHVVLHWPRLRTLVRRPGAEPEEDV
ncbi:MAG: DUF4405 domain-containing protein [Coriobacteriales bacterium]|jgi:hypothetical protein|nr:DUF4405 domain-containing protein [Coriobacteriales bacterium]